MSEEEEEEEKEEEEITINAHQLTMHLLLQMCSITSVPVPAEVL
jgi:hypothetical protein